MSQQIERSESQLLVSRVTGHWDQRRIHISGNRVNQELAVIELTVASAATTLHVDTKRLNPRAHTKRR
jgi:hypothetical protein